MIYALGIEDTFIGEAKEGQRVLDEYELTQHYENWEEDLQKALELGATQIRYGIPWYKIQPNRHTYDWDWVDNVINWFIDHPEIEPIIDFVHYGCPLWLENSFLNEEYPEIVSEYALEFFSRYGDNIKRFCPLNEPYVNAHFSCVRSEWPPYTTSREDYYGVVYNIAKGIVLTSKKVKDRFPDSISYHVDACSKILNDQDGIYYAKHYIFWDLLHGKVDENYPLYKEMVSNGFSNEKIKWFSNNKFIYDYGGINFYPQFSVLSYEGGEETPVYGTGSDLKDIVENIYNRYSNKLFITETSVYGSSDEKIEWINTVDNLVKNINQEKQIIDGWTYFPFIDMIDWPYRINDKSIEQMIIRFGLYSLSNDGGKLNRIETSAAEYYRKLAKGE